MVSTKIVIAGIGAVGGYLGGMLAKKYVNNKDVDIIFFVRGENLKHIEENGLKIISGKDECLAHPTLATHEVAKIGKADIIFFCTKSYGLPTICDELSNCIESHTILIPFLNGIDPVYYLKKRFPDNLVLNGCVYIVSRLRSPGVIWNSGHIQKFFIGPLLQEEERLQQLEEILLNAHIDAVLTNEIEKAVWEKFIFISAIATATSCYDKNMGDIMKLHANEMENLVKEISALAFAKGIPVEKNIVEKTMEKMKCVPNENTSSMHSDFERKSPQTELESLTGYVVREAKKLNITTPVYEKMYLLLSKK